VKQSKKSTRYDALRYDARAPNSWVGL